MAVSAKRSGSIADVLVSCSCTVTVGLPVAACVHVCALLQQLLAITPNNTCCMPSHLDAVHLPYGLLLQDVRDRFHRVRDVRTVERAWTEAYNSGDYVIHAATLQRTLVL
jgi:hypothetical protein